MSPLNRRLWTRVFTEDTPVPPWVRLLLLSASVFTTAVAFTAGLWPVSVALALLLVLPCAVGFRLSWLRVAASVRRERNR